MGRARLGAACAILVTVAGCGVGTAPKAPQGVALPATPPYTPVPPVASREPRAVEGPAPPEPPGLRTPDPRAATLLKAGENLERSGKTTGAIGFYQQVVKEFRGSPESERAATRLVALGGAVPSESDSVAPKRPDPFSPPKRPRYVNQVREREALARSLGQAVGSYVEASNRPPVVSPGLSNVSTSGLCGAPTLDGTPCRNRVQGGGPCYLHR